MFCKPIKYPKSFVKQIREIMPYDPEILVLIEKGSGFSVEKRLEEKGQIKLLKIWRQIFENNQNASIMKDLEQCIELDTDSE